MDTRKELKFVAAVVLGLTLFTANNFYWSNRGYKSGQLELCNRLAVGVTGGIFRCEYTKYGLAFTSPREPGKALPVDKFLAEINGQ